jgi:hypothetical protein
MRKRINLLSSIAVAIVFLMNSPASAHPGTPAYNTTLYSDSSHTTVVGYITWVDCDRNDYPYYELSGSNSPYPVDELVGYCHDGWMIWV